MCIRFAIYCLLAYFSSLPVQAEENGSTALSEVNSTSINVIEQNYEATKPMPPMAGMVSGPVTSPSLFNIIGRPAHVTGLPLWSQTAFLSDTYDKSTGESGGTTIIYNGIDHTIEQGEGKGSLKLNFSGRAHGLLAGSITAESRMKKAQRIDFPTLLHDVGKYIRDIDSLKGHRVTLLTVPEAMSFSMGVDTESKGFSVGSTVSKFFDSTAGILTGLSGGTASTGGLTAPHGTVGCTFLIVVESPDGKTIDINHTYRNYMARVNGRPVNYDPESEEHASPKARKSEASQQDGMP